MPRPVWSGTISFGLVAIPIKMFHAVSKKSVSFNQLDERTTQPHPPEEGVRRYRRGRARREHRQGLRDQQGPLRRRRPRRAGAVHPVGDQEHRPRGVRRPRRDRPGVLRLAVHPRPRQDTQAVRPAGPGDGGRRQGRHRSLRDAQQAVRRCRARLGRHAVDEHDGVRRRGRARRLDRRVRRARRHRGQSPRK